MLRAVVSRWQAQNLLAPAAQAAAGGRWAASSSSSSSSSAAAASAPGAEVDLERKKLVNKLTYRSKQRGFLELDLLVGLWAEQHIPRMDAGVLQQFAIVLDQENPDLFKWLTGQKPAPEEMQRNPAYQALSSHVSQQLAAKSAQEAQAAAGTDWVRGWDDLNRSAAAGGGAPDGPAPAPA